MHVGFFVLVVLCHIFLIVFGYVTASGVSQKRGTHILCARLS